MDAMSQLSDSAKIEWYNRLKASHAAEGELINPRHVRLVRAWWAHHDELVALAAALGVDGGPQTESGGIDKHPPRP